MANNPPIYHSQWDQENELFYTQISGLVGFREVDDWEQQMIKESQKIPANTSFKFLVDEQNYEFENIEVHKHKREIMPKFLAQFDFKLSVLSDEELIILNDQVHPNSDNIRCIAIAMVHHDQIKMQAIEKEFGQENEKYLSDINKAKQWILDYPNN